MAIKRSKSWDKSKEYKQPFFYILGSGAQDSMTAAQADEYDPDAEENGGKQLLFLHRLDMGDLLELGIADEMDFMSKELMSKPSDTAEEKADFTSAMKKSGNFKKMQKTVDAICVSGVLDPKIYPVPEHEAARQKGLFYVDEIPWDDRMELFAILFDTEGLSTFREEPEISVGNVENVTDVSLPPDGPVEVRPSDAEGVLLQ